MPTDNKQPTNNIQPVIPVTNDMPPVVMSDDQPPVVMEDTTPPMLSTTDLPLANPAPVVSDQPTPVTNTLSPDTSTGSAAPSDDIVMAPVITTQKKKFAGGKVIATILGLLVLIGGAGAGTYLVQRNQDIRERAACLSDAACSAQVDQNDIDYDGVDNYTNYSDYDFPEPEEDYNYDDDIVNYTVVIPPTINYDRNSCGPSSEVCGGDERCSSGTSCVPYCTGTEALNGYCPPPDWGGDGCMLVGDTTGVGECSGDELCHIQRGQTGTYGVCVNRTAFITACTGDGRQVSENSAHPSAVTCCEAGYVANPNGAGCVQGNTTTNNPPGGNPPQDNPPTTPPTITASCQNVKAYSSTWTLLTNTQLSQLNAGDSVNFCVTGVATGGSFDKAKFTINGMVQAETTTVRPSSTDFCQSYVIPAGITTFNVSAQINHVTLGWK